MAMHKQALRRAPGQDEMAPILREILAAYYIRGEDRRALGRRYGYAERTVQSFLGGQTYTAITGPILDLYAELGIYHRGATGPRARKIHAERLAAGLRHLIEDVLPILEAHGRRQWYAIDPVRATDLAERCRLVLGVTAEATEREAVAS